MHVISEAEALSSGTFWAQQFSLGHRPKSSADVRLKAGMSGFEVAGLVLGILPLAIKSIKSYRTSLSSWISAKEQLDWLLVELETEQIRLKNTCELLLHDIVPLSMIDHMIQDPFSAEWAKHNDRLRERLWDSWATFQKLVHLLLAAVTELEKKLGVDRNGSVCVEIHCNRSFAVSLLYTTYFDRVNR